MVVVLKALLLIAWKTRFEKCPCTLVLSRVPGYLLQGVPYSLARPVPSLIWLYVVVVVVSKREQRFVT